jgi:polysaccharide chain length determinant protein (PEP-CTERM system associated)
MATEYELTFTDYLSIMRRRAPYLIGAFIIFFLIAIIVAFVIPPTYISSGTIMVESQQVPDNMVPSAIRNQLEERINVIKQRVMTRESLLGIANKNKIFKENKDSLTTSALIEKLRDRIVVEPISSNVVSVRQGQPPITAFTISFEDQHPEVALKVANDLVSLFLDWNVKLRTEGAAETTIFLTQESDKLKAEVDRLEGMIAAYKKNNSDNLPEQLNLRANILARAENDLYEVERDIRSSNEALRSLEAELAAAKHGMGAEVPSQTLPALKAEYTRLSAIYTQSHPDIKALKRKIDALEHPPETTKPENASTDEPSLAVYMIQAKVDAANARLDSLTQQKKMLQGKIAQNEHAMMQTPKVAQELEVLIRDRDSAQRKFEEVLNKKMNAKIAENLESENKSERLTLIEPPILPEKPFKPNRIKIIALGFFLAFASSGGAVMLLESIDKRIRGTEALTHVLGYRPLVVIPYLPIQQEGVRKKRILKLTAIAAVVTLIVVVVALHFLYMPLDVLFMKILARME